MLDIRIGFPEFLLAYSAYIFSYSIPFSIIGFCLAIAGVTCRIAFEKNEKDEEKKHLTLLSERSLMHSTCESYPSGEGYH